MFKRYLCTYCGAIGNTKDHVIPRSWDGGTNHDAWVPSCSQCNNWLGSRPAHTVAERAELILGRLESSPLARQSAWSRWELDELTGDLRRYVAASETLRKIHAQRIEWAQLVIELDPDVDDVRIEAGLRESTRWRKWVSGE